jgi:nucleoside-diphosphate-sugar epimerase
MPRILIAGCGYIGEAAADLFHERGWKVEGWTESAQSAERLAYKPYSVRALDITDARAMSEVHEEFDVIVQCMSSHGGSEEDYRRIYLEGAQSLLHLFPAARHLFTSSTSVYAQKHSEIVDETSPANPDHEKGRILRASEELILAHDGIVARLAAIYGPGRSFLLRTILAGTGFFSQGNDRFINQAHRTDVASALFLLGERRADLGGEIYNVVDDQPILASQAVEWLATHLGRSVPLATATGVRKRGDTNKQVSNHKLRALGWELRFPNFAVGMTQSVLPSFGVER